MAYYSNHAGECLSKDVDREIRASHAGETGAVYIYRGALFAEFILNVVRPAKSNSESYAFICEHLHTEKQHLAIFENEMPLFRGSILLPLWIAAGFVTGFLPRMFGKNSFFYTVYCVEQFVDEHYENQCQRLSSLNNVPPNVIDLFRLCQKDEQQHRDDARAKVTCSPNLAMKCWGRGVAIGSSLAVRFAERL